MNGVFWAGLALGGVIAVLLAEFLDLSAWLAPRIVESAARKLPDDSLRLRYAEEWAAELAVFDGLKLVKLVKAVSIWRGSFATAAALSQEPRYTLMEYLRTLAANVRPGLVTALKVQAAILRNGRFQVDGRVVIQLGLDLNVMAAESFETELLSTKELKLVLLGRAKPTRPVRAIHKVVGPVLKTVFLTLYGLRRRYKSKRSASARS